MDGTDPQPVIDLATSYWRSATFLAANKLGLFAKIGDEPLTAAEIASACGARTDNVEVLLRALCSLELLRKEGEHYSNSPAAKAYLVPGQSTYLGEAIQYMQDVYHAWGDLSEAITNGGPATSPQLQLGGDDSKTRSFVLGMHNRALAIAPGIVEKVDLTGMRKLFDVGGGPGTYSLLFCKKYPDLKSEVLDLPAVVSVAREIAAEWQMDSRVEFRCGSYLEDKFGEDNDVVLMSGILHREAAETCREIIIRAAASVKPGGLCVAADIFLNAEKDGPEMATLFALNMFLTSDSGGAHSWTEIESWMQDAGLTILETIHLDPPSPHSIVVGRKE